MREPSADTRIKHVKVTAELLTVDLMDGRIIAAPLSWFPKLSAARARSRAKFKIIAGGHGIHWPDLDEDIGVTGLMRTNDGVLQADSKRMRRPARKTRLRA